MKIDWTYLVMLAVVFLPVIVMSANDGCNYRECIKAHSHAECK